MKVYIAAPFFNEEQVAIVQSVEDKLISLDIDFFSPRSEGVLKDMTKEQQQKSKRKIFDSNIKNMNECSHMIACAEHKDSGTIFEMGYFRAQKKPIIIYIEKIKLLNVMLAESAFSVCTDIEYLYHCIHNSYKPEIPLT